MPSINYHIDAAGANILKVVTDQVVTGLLDELDLSEVFADSIYIQQPFSAYSDFSDGKGGITFNKDRCDIEVNYIMDKTQVPWPVETLSLIHI